MKLEIKTNNRVRPLVTFNELPESVRSDFDYCKAKDTPFFVKVLNHWYDAFDTQRITTEGSYPMGWAVHVEKESPFAGWNAVTSETYWSGVLFKFKDEGVVVGCYFHRG